MAEWSVDDSDNLKKIRENHELISSHQGNIVSAQNLILEQLQLQTAAFLRMAASQEAMQASLAQLVTIHTSVASSTGTISSNIDKLTVEGTDHNKGIVTRETCSPCEVNSLSRAMTIASMKNTPRFNEVVSELRSPTHLPPAAPL